MIKGDTLSLDYGSIEGEGADGFSRDPWRFKDPDVCRSPDSGVYPDQGFLARGLGFGLGIYWDNGKENGNCYYNGL